MALSFLQVAAKGLNVIKPDEERWSVKAQKVEQ